MQFIDNKGTFRLENADKYTGLYMPIGSETGLKSAISPNLGGDAKMDQNHFLLEPVSIEGLHNSKNARNFWVLREGKNPWSLTGNSVWQQAEGKEHTTLTAGIMWHKIERDSSDGELHAEITSFVPVYKNVEIHVAEVTNTSDKDLEMRFVSAIPMYGRSAENIRDHRHVTSLLHRVSVTEDGVLVNPTLSFDERGHLLNDTTYFTFGRMGCGCKPESFSVEVNEFIGEGGSFEKPVSLMEGASNTVKPGYTANGIEALGGLIFEKVTVKPGEKKTYITFTGIKETAAKETGVEDLNKIADVWAELDALNAYWDKKINVTYHTGNPEFDGFMHWVSFQPEIRRLFGCSFLPHHDYGKGGRGWRDLWQDCLALLLMNPGGVREMLLSNFEGVRTDGTNATIIGSKPGEFKADRNGITRVWMDHSFWPLQTTALYIDQTGDLDILKQVIPYYKDKQVCRGKGVDEKWDGTLREKTEDGTIYGGTVLEHLLLQNLTAVAEEGEHGNLLLRDADWNDAVDMGGKKGESVAFTHAYAGNLELLVRLLSELKKSESKITVMAEMETLLSDDASALADYAKSVMHGVSGKTVELDIDTLINWLNSKTEKMRKHLRESEWIKTENGGYFRGYYDNDGNSLEVNNKQMMLTGQVFAIMCNTASDEDIKAITKSADELLFDEACGGYRLNTDFNEIKTNMGRMFGFAYGEKENGAVFSHMAVMYANGLYKRGFAHEGFKSLNALFTQSMTFEKGHIYPGIPEYFGRGGRGLYHYLTGAASWYMMTVVNEMFGVRGELGELVTEPKLLKEQFDKEHKASISLTFKGKAVTVVYVNPKDLDYGEYKVTEKNVSDDGTVITVTLG